MQYKILYGISMIAWIYLFTGYTILLGELYDNSPWYMVVTYFLGHALTAIMPWIAFRLLEKKLNELDKK